MLQEEIAVVILFLLFLTLMLAFVSAIFIYCLRFRIFRFIFKVIGVLFALILLSIICFCAFDVCLFYTKGYTLSSDVRLFIHFFCRPDDIYDPIVKFKIQAKKDVYSATVNHKYAGPYCVWIIDETNNHLRKITNETKRTVSMKLSNPETGKVFYCSSTNVMGWVMNGNIFTQCLWYQVPENVPLRRDVIAELEIQDAEELLRDYPNAQVEIRYAYHE